MVLSMKSYISIDGWKKNIRFSSAHIIPEYEKCGRLHGHTYAVHLKIYGSCDEKGIIIDFTILKDLLNKIVDSLDHRILIPMKSKILDIKENDDNMDISFYDKKYSFPKKDCVLLPIKSTSAENLSLYILDRIIEEIDLSSRINMIEIGVDEGYGQGARISKEIK